MASTLASMAIISIVTKEDSIQVGFFEADKMVQVLKMLLVGIGLSLAVNLLVWRQSARHVLRRSMATAAACLADKLAVISRCFLDGSDDEVRSPAYARFAADCHAAYARMSAGLREAKLEHYAVGREAVYRLDKRLCKSLEALAQAVGGLRSALDTQVTLLHEAPAAPGPPRPASPVSPGHLPLSPRLVRATSTLFADEARESLEAIDEADDEQPLTLWHARSDPALDAAPTFRAPSDIFSLFMALLGPSMKSLVYTLSETLRECPFDGDSMSAVTVNGRLRDSLRDAVCLYNNARANALRELYRSIELGRSRPEKTQADIEVAAACGHFSFTLQAVAHELDSYLDVLEDLRQATETWRRSWSWLGS